MTDIDANDREHPSYGQVHRGRDNLLNPGDKLPAIELTTVSRGTLSLPEVLESTYNILLFYRGHW